MNCMPYGDEAHSERKPGDQPLLKFWPYGLEQPDARWEELVEMLRCFCKDLMLVGTEGLIPFNAREVRSDISTFNLFANRGSPQLPGLGVTLPREDATGSLGNRLE